MKIIIITLLVFNILLIVMLHHLRVINTNQVKFIDRSLNYTEIVFETETYFKDFQLPDSLKNQFMLYVPEYVCNQCLDSALTVFKQFQDKNSNLELFIATAYDKERLEKFVRYKRLNCPIISDSIFIQKSDIFTYPILSFYSEKKNFVYAIPIDKSFLEPLKRFLTFYFSKNQN